MTSQLSEKEKMIAGMLYDPYEPELVQMRLHARILLKEYNSTDPVDASLRSELLAKLMGESSNAYIEPPFYCDYGSNIYLGENVYMNFNCTLLDGCEIHIGKNTLIGPSTGIYSASHPLLAKERQTKLECGKPISIGSDCWIGGHTVINPGVTIGNNTTIGSGSIVTKDIPPNVLAVGNPCRVIRHL